MVLQSGLPTPSPFSGWLINTFQSECLGRVWILILQTWNHELHADSATGTSSRGPMSNVARTTTNSSSTTQLSASHKFTSGTKAGQHDDNQSRSINNS